MRHLWIAGSVEAAYLLLDKAIGLGDALMLAQMLHPAFDEKGLDDAAPLRIFKHALGIGAVAAPPMLEARQRVEERFAVGRVDAIFDGDQHRAAIVFDRLRGQGRRPMHRRRQIQARAGLQFPTPGQRNRRHCTSGGEKVRIGKPDQDRRPARRRAAERQAAEKHGRIEASPRARTQSGNATWAETLKVAKAPIQDVPAIALAASAVIGSRARP